MSVVCLNKEWIGEMDSISCVHWIEYWRQKIRNMWLYFMYWIAVWFKYEKKSIPSIHKNMRKESFDPWAPTDDVHHNTAGQDFIKRMPLWLYLNGELSSGTNVLMDGNIFIATLYQHHSYVSCPTVTLSITDDSNIILITSLLWSIIISQKTWKDERVCFEQGTVKIGSLT